MKDLLCAQSLPWLTNDVLAELASHNIHNTADFLRTSNAVLDAFCRLSSEEISQSKAFFTAAVGKQIFVGKDLFSLVAGKQNTVKTKIESFDGLLCGGLRLGETLLVSHQYAQNKEMEPLVTNISNNILDSGNVIILDSGSKTIRQYPI